MDKGLYGIIIGLFLIIFFLVVMADFKDDRITDIENDILEQVYIIDTLRNQVDQMEVKYGELIFNRNGG